VASPLFFSPRPRSNSPAGSYARIDLSVVVFFFVLAVPAPTTYRRPVEALLSTGL